MFLLRDKLIMHGEKRETSTKTCNETMLRKKSRVFVSRISPPLLKHDDQSNFKACLKKSIKLQENETTFATFYKPAQYTGSIKYLNRMKIPYIALLNFAISKYM